MKQLDVLMRRYVRPLVRQRGFEVRGRSFRRDMEPGIVIMGNLQARKLGRVECEFFCNLAILVDVHIAWLDRFAGRPHPRSTASGLLFDRLRYPGKVEDHWQFDLDDTSAVSTFVDSLERALDRLVNLADEDALIELARTMDTRLPGPLLSPNRLAAEALLLLRKGDTDAVRELLPEVDRRDPSGDLAAWIEARLGE